MSAKCPSGHGHTAHCYQQHGCRCDACKAQMVLKRNRQKGREPKSEPSPCLCGCRKLVWSNWAPGHHKKHQSSIKPAGMTLTRALQIARGAEPREVVR